ncbi:MAG: HAD family hydrolase [Erysipelotrichaceae bacterium]|nr:HAD family hydrolase [Erysipelotrichaceae bacterium]
MSVKVVLFDMDNTIIDRQRFFEETVRQQVLIDHPVKDETYEQMVRDIIAWDENGHTKRDLTFEKYVEKYHLKRTAAEVNAYWEVHSGDCVYPFEDAYAVILELKKTYRVGLLSNGTVYTQYNKISHLPFKDEFEYTLVSGEIGIHKPDQRIFEKAAADLGVTCEECVYVGDNPKLDVIGAINSGMHPVWVKRYEWDFEVGDDVPVISQLSELPELLKRW